MGRAVQFVVILIRTAAAALFSPDISDNDPPDPRAGHVVAPWNDQTTDKTPLQVAQSQLRERTAADPPVTAHSEYDPPAVTVKAWPMQGGILPVPRRHVPIDVTNQSPSRGQDMLVCGFLRLPTTFHLTSHDPQSWFVARGSWRTTDGATLATWMQRSWGFTYQPVYFFVDSQLFMKAKIVHDPRELPFLMERDEEYPTVITFEDGCGQILYVIREHKTNSQLREIFNSRGDYLGGSTTSHGDPSQVRFFDARNKPIAVAQSPIITVVDARSVHAAQKQTFAEWQVKFFDNHWTASSLILDQNRWVIAVVLQENAVRDAAYTPSPFGAFQYSLMVAFVVACAVLIVVLIVVGLFTIAFPPSPKSQKGKSNPFLTDPNTYGALQRGQ